MLMINMRSYRTYPVGREDMILILHDDDRCLQNKIQDECDQHQHHRNDGEENLQIARHLLFSRYRIKTSPLKSRCIVLMMMVVVVSLAHSIQVYVSKDVDSLFENIIQQ